MTAAAMNVTAPVQRRAIYPTMLRIRCILVALFILACAAATSLRADSRDENIRKVVDSALAQTTTTKLYDAAYVSMKYPGGDVPPERGVCTDVVVRAFRGANVDLQRLVHEDMAAHFSLYPKQWGLRKPDSNIDHRRVPNLMKYFTRSGKSHPVTKVPADYQPGDVVTWTLSNGLAHTGLVTDRFSTVDPTRRLVVHNIGAGAQLEDVLFEYAITGHYRYF